MARDFFTSARPTALGSTKPPVFREPRVVFCVEVKLPGLNTLLQFIDELKDALNNSSVLQYILKQRLMKQNHAYVKFPTPHHNKIA
jgi:hypothetical protein